MKEPLTEELGWYQIRVSAKWESKVWESIEKGKGNRRMNEKIMMHKMELIELLI